MLRNVVLPGLLLGLFGCEWGYAANAETTATLVVEGTCPDADTVADGWHDGDGDRTEWHPVAVPLLCYYGVDVTPDADVTKLPVTFLDCEASSTSLQAVRDEAKRKVVPNVSLGEQSPMFDYFECTADGVVLVLPTMSRACPPPESALSGLDQEAGLEAHELLASDARAPWRSCTYHIDYETTDRPFSCSNGPNAPHG